jgi:hypothetical protein
MAPFFFVENPVDATVRMCYTVTFSYLKYVFFLNSIDFLVSRDNKRIYHISESRS